MKKFVPSLLILASFVSSAPCFALVRQLALCTTADGKYTVSVSDHQGIGFTRISNINADVTDSGGKSVASYKAEVSQGAHSISFHRPKFIDSATNGQGFRLEGPSTNARYYSVNVKMNVGENSDRISDDNLRCSVFGSLELEAATSSDPKTSVWQGPQVQ